MRTKLFSAIKVSILAIVLSFGLSFVYAWTAPTVTAPNGNVSAPINTSSTAQTKAGAFTVGSLITAGSATVGSLNAGSGAISTTGNISATQFSGSGAGLTGTAAGLTAGAISVAAPSFASTYTNAASFSADVLGGNKFYVFGYDDDKSLRFGFGTTPSIAGANVKMVMKSTGNVGIGDPAPVDKLSVVGSVGATGDICTTVTGAAKCLSMVVGGAPPQTTPYNTAGTFPIVVPPGLTSMRVTLIGGGGGGGGGGSRSAGGGGGGAGTLNNAVFNNLTSGANYTLIVGVGGNGGAGVDYPYVNSTQAVAGGTTSITGLLSAIGGARGENPFGAGAGGSIGGVSAVGNNGGKGGDSMYGTGGVGTGGGVGGGNGAGGGGGGYVWYSGSSGGKGSPGKAIVTFFDPNASVVQADYNTLLNALSRQGISVI